MIFSTHDMDMAEKLCDTIFMIFKGRKVLDGSIDSIQARYPANRVRVRFADAEKQVPRLPMVVETSQQGRFHLLTLRDPQDAPALMAALAEHGDLHLFEVVKPSLHDVFIRIAKPDPVEMTTA